MARFDSLGTDALRLIFSFLCEHRDILSIARLSRAARAALRETDLGVTLDSVRLKREEPWCEALSALTSVCRVVSLHVSNSDIRSGPLRHALERPWMRRLLTSKCFQLSPDLLDTAARRLDCAALSDMPRVMVPTQGHAYSRVRVLGLVNTSFDEGGALSLARTIMTGRFPRLQYLFLGGADGSLQRDDVQAICTEQDEEALQGRSLRMVEATYWSAEDAEAWSLLLSRDEHSHVMSLQTSPIAILDTIVPGVCGDVALRRDVRDVLAVATQCTSQDGRQRTQLHFAAVDRDVERVKWLLAAGAKVDAKDHRGSTPLFRACEAGSTREVQELLKAGADVWTRNQMREGSVFIAALRGCHEVIEQLMPHLKSQSEGRSRADEVSRWSTIDGDLYTPLHAAIIARSAPTLRVLLDSGFFGVDSENKYHQTGLHLASRSGEMELVQMLIERGADVDKLDEALKTPYDVAMAFGHREVAALLETHGGKASGRGQRQRRQRSERSRGRGRGWAKPQRMCSCKDVI